MCGKPPGDHDEGHVWLHDSWAGCPRVLRSGKSNKGAQPHLITKLPLFATGFPFIYAAANNAVLHTPSRCSSPTDSVIGGKRKFAKRTVDGFIDEPRLYDLPRDPGETTDIADRHPDEVGRLLAFVAEMDADWGIAKNVKGIGARPPGKSTAAAPLRMPASR